MKRRTPAVVIAIATLFLAGCGERPLNTFSDDSEIAGDLSTFLWWLLAVCAIVFVLVQGAVIYMSIKFRVDAPEDDDDIYPDDDFPEQIHGNTRLEIGWTILPTVIMAVVGVFTLGLLFDLDDVDARGSDPRIESVTVVGAQWWWEFQYHLTPAGLEAAGLPAGAEGPHIVTAGELPLPIGEEIALDVTSRDVIHSFWVPALNGKRDAVPGRTNPWTIQTLEEGRFPGECTEFCGLSHAYMEKWAVGLEQADWDAWAANQAADAVAPEDGTPAAEGWSVFANNCASCHVINGLTRMGSGGEGATDTFQIYDGANRLIDKQTQVSGAAPNLTHVMSRSTFGGGIFELYENPDSVPYLDLASDGDLNLGDLEAWIRNAPAVKANAWDSPGGQRGMTPFTALSDEDLDHLVAFLLTLD
ncbi:MAG: cytochrome c oxidase subunit II [Actinomycetota bacterium]